MALSVAFTLAAKHSSVKLRIHYVTLLSSYRHLDQGAQSVLCYIYIYVFGTQQGNVIWKEAQGCQECTTGKGF